ncbi:Oligopeptide transport ATP-binding protein OppF [Nocardioides dokdonensis FR1436]|uniref:Oligopeptide transport ATP-binding protein OppF n=1 Tax=Nocardioides dokdonensis FR1436 TaxID=1300347 RepID=A0A1A9GLX3_9ACTN|nr:ABC transporter ATP-binding protein [Nocardioides dokdonensis]ANH39274.1 Oligopeptide transport ATP-binding protein OppF [Nocardioides dokdonensis FR1436]
MNAPRIAAQEAPQQPLVSTRDLVHEFTSRRSSHTALDHVTLEIAKGASLGVVGESGSGKTTLVRCMLGLLKPTGGSVTFDGAEVTRMSTRQLRAMRRRVGMVFQNPVMALNPRMSVEECVAEPLRLHTDLRGADLARAVGEALESVALPQTYRSRLPHQLSGGQCQRVGIARALAAGPEMLILDEPTSALDVSVQAQILNLLTDLRAERDLTFVMISHSLDVVRYLSEHVVVMLEGRIVEEGSAVDVLAEPQHAYTRNLVAACPTIESDSLRSALANREEALK